ncbi:uncharacterized protein PHACADRAFT_251917 [Phanerochaete carnosa HHB-10118-sp]|uniref:CFA20 domain-containing protein n=1 Tax=Phanerochaete carnosa (strain HHB-10118-sp) TaxID=650164 RepID=K5WFW6_PHACS|nr:uncharacterized protein PHACADRAFT_251917 [Phanerochaete carnosa HHB-10118-sp]EKM57979.1 hypothetical protein PHACADRAFT_251917 [Phanerochaete carnosa HHB-10118-sp]
MFAHNVQPPLVSLFSSTGSDPLAIWAVNKHDELPDDSVVCLLEDKTSEPAPPGPAKLIEPPAIDSVGENGRGQGYTLSQTVLHIQSPVIRTTYIRCPSTGDLDMKHPWMHLQVRSLGKDWSFEAGVVDRAGREGIARFSTFQVMPLSLRSLFCYKRFELRVPNYPANRTRLCIGGLWVLFVLLLSSVCSHPCRRHLD